MLLLVLDLSLKVSDLLAQVAQVERLALGRRRPPLALVLEAVFELLLGAQQLLDAPQRALQERPPRARLLGVAVGFALLGVAHLGERVRQLLLGRTELTLHRVLGLLDQLALALLQLGRGPRLALHLLDLVVEGLDGLAREQDVEQALEVRDDLALLAQRLGEGRRLDVLADARDVAQDPGALEVREAFFEVGDLLGLAFTLVADLEARHQLLQALGLAEDLVLVAAEPLQGRRVGLLGARGRERARGRDRDEQGCGRSERTVDPGHHLPLASSVRFCRSRWRSRRARTSWTRSW